MAFTHRCRPRSIVKRGDCLELLARLPASSVDMVLCDLPYGVLHCAWDKRVALVPLWSHYRRIVKPRSAVVLFATQPYATEVIGSNRRWFRCEWIWDKRFCTGFGNAHHMPMRRHENILVFSRDPSRYFPQGVKHIHRVRCSKGATSIFRGSHAPTYVQRHTGFPNTIIQVPRGRDLPAGSKPVELLEYLIRTYTRVGDTVLDNCMGLGSTGVACVRTGRNFIGIELDPRRCAAGHARIEAALKERNRR